ncbi:MAG: NAD(P)H-dependent oxidoreductase subunit E [Calditrichaeota bacterium]|jgi:NADH:ubiquinone oxidoreductase subunit E|nr:NAD(P)H-dependent oxidoreductase subunit E [Calditrichota bacterium]MBT7618127.1 NAD(P)H-dependent oxidoreductase subunit E [Calditrichota bacterium]MBT7788408.1 NAD(P)H-dependent oxidoreductase subunit E [Calditrichota bacterium]
MDSVDIQDIVEKYNQIRGGLIGMLDEIQARYRYLPQEALNTVAEQTKYSMVDIYGVATFYKSFSLEPRGKHVCSVCKGTACHVRNAPAIAEEFEKQLNIKAGQTTEDEEFTLETVNCLGACALGPIVVADGHYFSNVKTAKVKEILQETRSGLDNFEAETDEKVFPVEVSCSRCNHTLMDGKHLIEGHPSIRFTASYGRNHGAIRFSSLYGSYTADTEYDYPDNEIVHFFCPHCKSELLGASDCSECGAPTLPMIVQGGGIVSICSRRGCRGHMLDLNGVNN